MLYERVLRPLFFTVHPEGMHQAMHHASVLMARSPAFCRLLERLLVVNDSRLRIRVAGLDFPNPVGLAAGFDKTGEMAGVLARVGFGFLEVGSVTLQPWAGNPKPRVFRLPADEAIINRMGLNNPGVAAAVAHLGKAHRSVPVGISVAKTPDPAIMGDAGLRDFIGGVVTAATAADYLALNVSCPNTAEGKTFEDPALLDALLGGIAARTAEMGPKPLFVKFSPDRDSTELDALLAICCQHGVGGIIIGNTTTARAGLVSSSARVDAIGRGGLSGRPLRDRALALVARAYAVTEGRLPIIGCGGIFHADDAYRFIRAGASLVQIYTGMIYRGPQMMGTMNRGLAALLARDGFADVAAAVGADQK